MVMASSFGGDQDQDEDDDDEDLHGRFLSLDSGALAPLNVVDAERLVTVDEPMINPGSAFDLLSMGADDASLALDPALLLLNLLAWWMRDRP
jgi:hypothetical protein